MLKQYRLHALRSTKYQVIVYEDDDILVINKPMSLVVHPGAGNLLA